MTTSRPWDVTPDANRIGHGAVGIQLGPGVAGAIVYRNEFTDVSQPLLEAVPGSALQLDKALP